MAFVATLLMFNAAIGDYNCMCTHQRLQQALITSLATLALNLIELDGSFRLQVYIIHNNAYREVMELAAGGPVTVTVIIIVFVQRPSTVHGFQVLE